MTVRDLTSSVDRGRGVVSDGGRTLTDLSAFERDLLYAVRALEQDSEPPKGLAIKARLEAEYCEEINHSRLYQNLDSLNDNDLITKRQRDGRTNEYATTEEGQTLLEEHASHRVTQVGTGGGVS